MRRISLLLFCIFLACCLADPSSPVEDSPEDTTSVSEDVPVALDSPVHLVGNTPVTWDRCGTRPSYHACNFELLDQNGENFQLYDHYGMGIVLDFSTMWCGPCNTAAFSAQEHYDHYIELGLLYATVLIENEDRDAPSVADALRWADTHGITSAPVLVGDRSLLESSGGSWRLTGWPTFYLIDQEMEMYVSVRGWNEEYLFDYIDELL